MDIESDQPERNLSILSASVSTFEKEEPVLIDSRQPSERTVNYLVNVETLSLIDAAE